MLVSMRTRVSLLLIGCAFVLLGAVRSASAATASKITIDPAAPTTTADAAITFTVIATNTDGTTTNVSTQTTLSTNDPRGSVANNVYTPGAVGTWNVQASYQSLQATASVTVTAGSVQEIVINPNSDPEQTFIGATTTFSTALYDKQSNVVSSQTATWSVLGEIGTINDKGVFTPVKVGTGKIQAKVGDITGQISVVVNAAPVANTNTAVVVKNTNTPATNANVNTSTTTNTNTSTTTTTTKAACTTLKPWAWSLMLVLFFVVIAILYALVPVTAIWPAVIGLAGAAALAFIQRKYGCGGQPWWPWIVTLGAIALTAAALQFRPKHTDLPQ